jgi:glycerophosphoryl diester phosphodiesterase
MRILFKTFNHLKAHFTQYFIFEAIMMLLSSTIILPQILRLYQWALIQTGTPYIINAALLKPDIISVRFWITIVGLFIFGLIILFEYLMLMSLVDGNINNRPVTLLEAFVKIVRNLKRTLVPGMLHLLSMSVLLIPMIIGTSQFNPINLTLSIYDLILRINQLSPTWLAVIVLWLYLHIHTLYFTYFMLIDACTVKDAIRMSFAVARHNKLKMLLLWVPAIVVFVIIWLFLSIWVQMTAEWVTTLLLLPYIKKIIIYALSIFTYNILLLSFPFLVTYLVILFHDIRKTQENNSDEEHTSNALPLSEQESSILTRWPKWLRKLHSGLGILITIILIFYFGLNYIVVESIVGWDVEIAAHRGGAGNAPENSLAAIQSAIDRQVEAVELDVMLTRDYTPILFHDKTFKRLLGINLLVSELTYETISTFDIGPSFSADFKETHIPTLEEALLLCKGQIDVILDMKDYGNNEILVPKVVSLIEALEMEDTVTIQSFNSTILKLVRALNPEIELGQIMFFSSGDLAGLDVNFYTIRDNMLTKQFVDKAHALDREVWVWTVNSVINLNEVLRYDIDGIITDYPTRAQSVRNLHR